jgi:hypothetical protein
MRPDPHPAVFNCEKKDRWSDEESARAAVSLFAKNAPDGKLWVYRCTTCLGWHCTKKDHGLEWLVKQGQPYNGLRAMGKPAPTVDRIAMFRDRYTRAAHAY